MGYATESFSNNQSFESIEETSPPPNCRKYSSMSTKKIKKCPKTKKKKKSKSKMSKLRNHKNKNPNQSKFRRRASLKLHKKQTNDATFFGLLPELDEENEKKQMSENEIVRFENEL